MYIYIYIYIYINVYICIHRFIHIFMYIYKNVHIYTCLCVLSTPTFIYIAISTYECSNTNIYI